MAKKDLIVQEEQTTVPTKATMKTNLEMGFEKAQYLIEKKLVPAAFNKPEQLLQVIAMGAGLGMDEMQSVNSIDLIQGVLAIKAKMIPGLLAKHGIAIEVLKDYEPIYKETQAVMMSEDKKVMYDKDNQVRYHLDPETGKVKIKREETGDFITTVRFKRYFPNIGVVTNDVSFKWSMAISAEWHLKSNWKKMPEYMMMARCITRGARIAAADIMGGLYDNYEVSEFSNMDVEIDED
jgi:hypothetical protein